MSHKAAPSTAMPATGWQKAPSSFTAGAGKSPGVGERSVVGWQAPVRAFDVERIGSSVGESVGDSAQASSPAGGHTDSAEPAECSDESDEPDGTHEAQDVERSGAEGSDGGATVGVEPGHVPEVLERDAAAQDLVLETLNPRYGDALSVQQRAFDVAAAALFARAETSAPEVVLPPGEPVSDVSDDSAVRESSPRIGVDEREVSRETDASLAPGPGSASVSSTQQPYETVIPRASELRGASLEGEDVRPARGAAAASNAPAVPDVEQLPRPGRTRIMTIANQKGGVGKTTTTVNIAAALATAGLRVLVIDMDPQGNASTALGVDHRAEVPSIYDVVVDERPLREVIAQSPDVAGLWCAPATIDLAGAEIELVSLVARESRLKWALDALLQDEQRFDYVLIDCPPSLGLLTVNAFVAANEVFIPIQCEYYALEGLSQLLKNVEMIKRHLNPGLHVSTILMTMYDARTRLSAQVADEVRAHFPDQVLRTRVPRSVRISEAPSFGQTVISYDPTSSGALSYLEAARELTERATV